MRRRRFGDDQRSAEGNAGEASTAGSPTAVADQLNVASGLFRAFGSRRNRFGTAGIARPGVADGVDSVSEGGWRLVLRVGSRALGRGRGCLGHDFVHLRRVVHDALEAGRGRVLDLLLGPSGGETVGRELLLQLLAPDHGFAFLFRPEVLVRAPRESGRRKGIESREALEQVGTGMADQDHVGGQSRDAEFREGQARPERVLGQDLGRQVFGPDQIGHPLFDISECSVSQKRSVSSRETYRIFGQAPLRLLEQLLDLPRADNLHAADGVEHVDICSDAADRSVGEDVGGGFSSKADHSGFVRIAGKRSIALEPLEREDCHAARVGQNVFAPAGMAPSDVPLCSTRWKRLTPRNEWPDQRPAPESSVWPT